jgi:uncharacterized protein
MLFAMMFTDKADHAELRAKNLQAHIEWLDKHREIILIAGSLRADPADNPKGGLWIAKADSREQLSELLKTDPFYISGLRQSFEIFHWSKANSERKVLI